MPLKHLFMELEETPEDLAAICGGFTAIPKSIPLEQFGDIGPCESHVDMGMKWIPPRAKQRKSSKPPRYRTVLRSRKVYLNKPDPGQKGLQLERTRAELEWKRKVLGDSIKSNILMADTLEIAKRQYRELAWQIADGYYLINEEYEVKVRE